MDIMPLGERIRAARLERKMTQDELARDTFSKSYVSAVELGKIQPSIKALRILARRLQLPASFFLETLEPDIETQQTSLALSRIRLRIAANDFSPEMLDIIKKLDLERLSEPQVAELLFLEARTLMSQQRDQEALNKLEQSRLLWEELDDSEWIERVRNLAGEIYFRQRKFIQAQEMHKVGVVAIHEGKVRDVTLQLSIYSNLALVYSALDLHDTARSLFEEANKVAGSASSVTNLIETQNRIASQYEEEEKYSAATRTTEKAISILDNQKIYGQVTQLHLVFGQVYSAGHSWQEAEACFRSALESAKPQIQFNTIIIALTNLANLYLRQDRIEEALEAAMEARRNVERNPSQSIKSTTADKISNSTAQRALGEITLTLAKVNEKKGYKTEADTFFNEALETLKLCGDPELLSSAYFSFGEALLARGEAPRGAQYLKLAYEERSRGNG